MPHCRAKDLSVRLSKADLLQSTPQPARISQAKEVFSRNDEAIALVFDEGDKTGVLAETPLRIGEDELALNIIDRQENTPFAVILAGEASDALPESGALCLTVVLSSRTFKIDTPKQPGVAKDLKIDVFLDGVLCGSAFVARRFSTETRSGTEKHKRPEQTVRFAGRRIGQHLEKPWVLLTSREDEDNHSASTQAENTTAESIGLANTQSEDTTADPNQPTSTEAENVIPETKWNAVNATLLQYADQVGKDDTFLGRYITSLASLPLPAEIGSAGNKSMPPRSRSYGIFDVVVTAGKGSKAVPLQGGFLEDPTALELTKIIPLTPVQRLVRQHNQDLSILGTPSMPVAPVASRALRQPSTRYRVPDEVKQAMSHSDRVKNRWEAPGTLIPEPVPGFAVLGKRTRGNDSSANTPQTSSSSSQAPNSVAPLTPTPSLRPSPPAPAPAATRPSIGGEKSTGEGSGFQPVNVPEAEIPITKEQEMAKSQAEAEAKAPKPMEPQLELEESPPESEESLPEPEESTSEPPKSRLIILSCDFSKLYLIKRRRLNATAASRAFMNIGEIVRQEATFTPAPAGRVGYAPPRVVRQVRMERGGEFTEEEVVYGCRILV